MAKTKPAMAIFLGKNYLGQKDKQELEHTIKDVKEIKKEIEEVFEQ